MKELGTKAWANVLLWKLAIVKVVLFSLVTLGAAWQVATAGMDFGALSYWDRVNIVVGILVLWGNQMISFFDKTASQISSGRPPIGATGDTELLKRQSQPENG